jgi:MOSC domain-containing protein YiiM
MTGYLRGIAFKRTRRGAMETAAHSNISVTKGVANDRLGSTSKRRQVTVLRAEDWAAACAELGVDLPWTSRRANLLVEGLPSFKGKTGEQLRIGSCVLEITGECDPCSRMDEVCNGLQAVLAVDWRGGATCRVLFEGDVAIGNEITLKVEADIPNNRCPRA